MNNQGTQAPDQATILNVALCSDANFYEGLETALASIMRYSHDGVDQFNFFVVDGGMTSAQISQLGVLANKLAKKYQTETTLNWQTVEPSIIQSIEPLNGAFTFYVRLLLPQLFPEQSWMLWVDADVLCMKNMSSLSSMLNSKTPIFGAIDSEIPTLGRESPHADKLNTNAFDLSAPYINTGLSLIDLNFWRTHNLSEKLLKWAHQHREFTSLFDQTIINWNLSDQIGFLPGEYNVLRCKPDKILENNKNPINYHFAGSFKPWLLNFKINAKYAPMVFCQVMASYEYLKVRSLEIGEQRSDQIEKLRKTAQELHKFLNRRGLSLLAKAKLFIYNPSIKPSRVQCWQENHHFYSTQVDRAKAALEKLLNETSSGQINESVA